MEKDCLAIVFLVLLFEIRTKIRICPKRRMHADKLVRELRVPKPEKGCARELRSEPARAIARKGGCTRGVG